MDNETDEALYRRVLSGDTAAFVQLVTRYNPPLFRFLYRQTANYPLAEDLLQETFIRLIVYQGQPPDCFRAWAYTLASNLVRDHFRSAPHRHEVELIEDESLEQSVSATSVHELDDRLAMADSRAQVEHALQQLTPDHREALILRFYQDLPIDEIATISGVPPGTVKSRLSYALKRLRGLLVRVGALE